MPVNEYALDLLVRERLGEARLAASRLRLAVRGRPRRSRVRRTLGTWLVRLGAWLRADPVLAAR